MTKHPIDVFSLGAGLLFSVLAVAYLLVPDSMSAAVVFPLMLMALGVIGIVAAVVAQSRQAESAAPVTDDHR